MPIHHTTVINPLLLFSIINPQSADPFPYTFSEHIMPEQPLFLTSTTLPHSRVVEQIPQPPTKKKPIQLQIIYQNQAVDGSLKLILMEPYSHPIIDLSNVLGELDEKLRSKRLASLGVKKGLCFWRQRSLAIPI